MKKCYVAAAILALTLAGCGGCGKNEVKIPEASNIATPTPAAAEEVITNEEEESFQPEVRELDASQYPLITSSEAKTYDKADIDTTAMAQTEAYEQITKIADDPTAFVGKIIKVKGPATTVYDDDNMHSYKVCMILDEDGCSTGIEFMPSEADSSKFPNDGVEVTVIGEFQSYNIGEFTYYTLKDARIL